MSDIGGKVQHVLRARQSRDHECHWPGCGRQVKPAVWGCREHWYRLPQALRNRIWRTYRAGQENDMRPSAGYTAVAREVHEWIASRGVE